MNAIPALLRGDPATEIDLHARLVDAELIVGRQEAAAKAEAEQLAAAEAERAAAPLRAAELAAQAAIKAAAIAAAAGEAL